MSARRKIINKLVDLFTKGDDPAKAYRPGYVYKTVNTVDGMKYIGSKLSRQGHKGTYFDEKYYGSGPDLRAAIDEHGIDKFINVKEMDTRTFNGLKNAEEGLLGRVDAAGSDDYYNNINKYQVGKGNLPSQKTKDRISKSSIGKNKGKPSPSKGKVMSAEQKKKISDSVKKEHAKNPRPGSNIGRKFSPEARANMRKAQLKYYKNNVNHNKGRVHTEESKANMTEAAKNRKNKGLL